jgi:hypothetical protein
MAMGTRSEGELQCVQRTGGGGSLAKSARLALSRATASKVMGIDIVLSEHLNISRECRQSRRCPQLRNIVTYRNVQRDNLMWDEDRGANEIAHEDTWSLGVSCII